MWVARALLILAATLTGLSTIGPTRADDPTQVTLAPIPPANAPAEQESVILAAQLTSDHGPIADATIDFYIVTTVFGERLMKVGAALSDATGTASVMYRPTWEGDYTVVARFGGGSGYGATQTSFHFAAQNPPRAYEPPRFGLEPVRQLLPLAVGLALLAVLGSLAFAFVTAVTGIRAEAGNARGVPIPIPYPSSLGGSLPIGRIVAAVAVLALGGLLATLLLGGKNGPEETGTAGQALPTGIDTLPPPETLTAQLIRSVPTLTFDANGQPAPDSVAMPADLVVNAGRMRILDSVKGRIVTVTPSGGLATILESDRSSVAPLKGATVMASFDETLYVVLAKADEILVIDSNGAGEGVVSLVIPAGPRTFEPGGMAVTESGEIWLSDAANHRVVALNERGEFERVIGEGVASTSPHGFDTPGGLTVDQDGNLYVADTGNKIIKKFSPLGTLLQEFGEGRLSRPNAVAVNQEGVVFVSDAGAALISVFSPDGGYVGAIGGELLEAPHSVRCDGSLLYVMDQLTGLFVFEPNALRAGGS